MNSVKPPIVNLHEVDWSVFSMMVEARRHFLGLSRCDMCDLLNVPFRTVKAAESGRKIKLAAYLAYCHWYGVRFEWFYRAEILAKRRMR